MNALVLFDSNYGNTRQVAKAIGETLGSHVPVKSVDELRPESLQGYEVLVVGSPINAWRPTGRMSDFLAKLRPGQLIGCNVAVFDTRIDVFFHGDATKEMVNLMVKAGATPLGKPKWFFVQSREGPLKDGELDRARTWAESLLEQS